MNAYNRIKFLADANQEEADKLYSAGDRDYVILQECANTYQHVLEILIDEGFFDENGNRKATA